MFWRWLVRGLSGAPRADDGPWPRQQSLAQSLVGPNADGLGDRSVQSLWGARVLLRPGRNSDWEAWADLRQRSRAFLTPWEPDWPADALSRAGFRRRLSRQRLAWREDSSYAFFTFDRSTMRLVGGITLNNVHRGVAQSACVGYWIGEPFARCGYTREALHLSINFAFAHLSLHRLEAACMPHNLPSQNLLAQAGFQREGLARGYLRINGVWADHYLYGLLREDVLNGTPDGPCMTGHPESQMARE